MGLALTQEIWNIFFPRPISWPSLFRGSVSKNRLGFFWHVLTDLSLAITDLLLLFYILLVVILQMEAIYVRCALFVKFLPKGLMLIGLPLVFYQYNGALYWSFSLQLGISFANSPAKGSPLLPPPPVNVKCPLNVSTKQCIWHEMGIHVYFSIKRRGQRKFYNQPSEVRNISYDTVFL